MVDVRARKPSMNLLKNANGKRAISIAAAVLSVGLLGFVVARHTVLAEPSLNDLSRQRTAIDSETGKIYENFRVKDGLAWPWKNPDTGQNTLYPPEFCYWTKDGKAKMEPTLVLLNELVGCHRHQLRGTDILA